VARKLQHVFETLFITLIFGCWHRRLSRPVMSQGGHTKYASIVGDSFPMFVLILVIFNRAAKR
jgi:hypothetical protein